MTTKNKKSLWLYNLTSLCLIAAIFISTSMIALAAPGTSLAGEIIVSGNDSADAAVTLNGEPVLSGRTFLGSGTIATSDTRSATINLGKLGRVTVSPKSVVSLTLSDNGISGDLSAGQIHVSSKAGTAVNITTPDNAVSNDASQARSFTVDVSSGSTVATGEVTLEKGQPTAANLSKKEKGWIAFSIIAGIVVIAIIVTNDDEVTSPVN